MKKTLTVKSLVVTASILVALLLSVTLTEEVSARSHTKSGSSSSSHHKSSVPKGGEYRPNSFGQKSLSGDCKKINGQCVTFSTKGCRNFYIKGYHYGGSQACRVLGTGCKKEGGGGGSSRTNGGGGAVVNNSNTNTNTNITRNCTPGVNCPDSDLGKIITKARLGSSIASSANNTCPFFWTVGNEDADRKIECQLVTNGKITILPKLQPDTVNGQPLPIGLTKFICARGNGVATTTEEVSLSCSGNPNVIER